MGRHFFILIFILVSWSIVSFGQDPMLQIELHIYKNGKEIKNSNDYKVVIIPTAEFSRRGRNEFMEDKGHFLYGDVMLYQAEPILIRITQGNREMSVLLTPPEYVRNDRSGLTFFKLKIRFREGSFKVSDFLTEKEKVWGTIWKNKKLRRQRSRD